jgi:hypothetical protein
LAGALIVAAGVAVISLSEHKQERGIR